MTGKTAGNRRPTLGDAGIIRDTFEEDVLAGLALPQKAIPAKHFYDARGSDLFDGISRVAEYYPTRTELEILDARLPEIAKVLGPDVVLIEPGAGSGEKAERVLRALESPKAFVPVEISRTALDAAADALAERFEGPIIAPVCADFSRSMQLPDGLPEGRRVVFFPGSTLGNFEDEARADLLRSFARAAGEGGYVLLGADLVKDGEVLRAAYNDADGVTAAFNLNLLHRINRDLDGTFEIDAFEHDAPWIAETHRIEMRLVAKRATRATVRGREFTFEAGEWIHTENSIKLTPERLDDEAAGAGLRPVESWTDANDWFRVALYRVA